MGGCSGKGWSNSLLWSVFFGYTAILALLVQLVLLPYVFPQWHAGDGLLIHGDWLNYHRLAVEKAEEIDDQGWSVWTLRPDGYAPAGIASAIYALIVPKPWTLIPLNAALHATATLVLLCVIRLFFPNRHISLLAILPFFLFPSTALWTTQILKDGYSIAGFLLFLYGFILLVRVDTWQRVRWLPVFPLIWIVSGAFLIWIVRPYMLRMMQAIAVGLGLFITVVFLLRLVRSIIPRGKVIVGALLPWAVVLLLSFGLSLGERAIWMEIAGQEVTTVIDGVASEAIEGVDWNRSQWLPDSVEDFFYTLATVRHKSCTLSPMAASNVDVDVRFERVVDVFAYLPRAIQIAFLAPFPTQWFEQGSYNTTTLMRRVSAVEMIGVYVGLVLLPLSLWQWRRRPEIWVFVLFCAGMMVAYGLVIANIGSLYRIRYPFLMPLVALGIAGGVSAYQRWSCRSRTKHNSVSDP